MNDRAVPVPLPGTGTAVPARFADRVRTPIVWINLVGVALVGVALLPGAHGPLAAVPLTLGLVALAAWVVWTLLPLGAARDAVIMAGGLAAAVGTGSGVPAMIAPLIAAVVVLLGFTARSVGAIAAFVLACVVALGIAAAVRGLAPEELLTLYAGVAIGVMLGITRRQRRIGDERERALLAQSVAAERETERARLLEDRAAIARDVHDVLAHSLGGLVLQLDAIEALLERGRVEEAAVRAAAARGLAGEGLAEARRAVAALRDPGTASAPPPDSALTDLVATHRSLGGGAEVTGDLSLAGLDAPHRDALTRMLQEALSNARRHAPGAVARIVVRRSADVLEVTVTTPLTGGHAAGAGPGGGHGLIGMRERFAALGDGSIVTAGPSDGRFVVDARLVRS